MKQIFLSLAAFLIVLLSCEKDNPTGSNTNPPPIDSSDFKYPFTIGSTWSYTYVQSVENIRPDSIKHYYNDYPKISSGTITVSHDTTINGIQTRCFLETFTLGSNTRTNRTYYANYDTGLVCYGYRNTSDGIGFPFKASSGVIFIYNKITVNNLSDLFLALLYNYSTTYTNDTLIQENPPVNCVKYPVKTGTEWFFKGIGYNLYINKKYLGFENIIVNNRYISCMKTERKWFGGPLETYFYDYHSRYGQMKRDYYIKNVILANEFGDTLGFVDLRYKADVTSFNIVNP